MEKVIHKVVYEEIKPDWEEEVMFLLMKTVVVILILAFSIFFYCMFIAIAEGQGMYKEVDFVFRNQQIILITMTLAVLFSNQHMIAAFKGRPAAHTERKIEHEVIQVKKNAKRDIGNNRNKRGGR